MEKLTEIQNEADQHHVAQMEMDKKLEETGLIIDQQVQMVQFNMAHLSEQFSVLNNYLHIMSCRPTSLQQRKTLVKEEKIWLRFSSKKFIRFTISNGLLYAITPNTVIAMNLISGKTVFTFPMGPEKLTDIHYVDYKHKLVITKSNGDIMLISLYSGDYVNLSPPNCPPGPATGVDSRDKNLLIVYPNSKQITIYNMAANATINKDLPYTPGDACILTNGGYAVSNPDTKEVNIYSENWSLKHTYKLKFKPGALSCTLGHNEVLVVMDKATKIYLLKDKAYETKVSKTGKRWHITDVQSCSENIYVLINNGVVTKRTFVK